MALDTQKAESNPATSNVAVRMVLTGRVQGIGMRPAIARLAKSLELKGCVWNSPKGVELHVQGSAKATIDFQDQLLNSIPEQAVVQSIDITSSELRPLDSFSIVNGSNQDIPETPIAEIGSLSANVPLDRVICDKCILELTEPENRRFEYPFVSCTDCGPRYSILRKMPYERADTSLSDFPLCPCCREEYENLLDRRFHCQNNACPECGPRIWLRDENDRTLCSGNDALLKAVDAIKKGQIVALRGLGGYQLLVDATSDTAISRLRKRKNRFGKPLAVIVRSIEKASQLADLSALEKETLLSAAGPILIATRKSPTDLSPLIDEGLNTVGLMLPTTPLHLLITEALDSPAVCTSGNRSESPLVYQYRDAIEQLNTVADLWLEHDRPIERPVDDSVVRVIANKPVTIRLARGLAPLPLSMESFSSSSNVTITAFGGHQKAAIGINNGSQSILAPYIGDMDTIESRERFVEQKDAVEFLYEVSPKYLVCDQHPDYFGSRLAREKSHDSGTHLIEVQHHHAHIAAGMLEHGWERRQVFGVAFDGTGFGKDETIWGGEFMIATTNDFKRVGRLLPFSLVGGDKVARQPWRASVAMLYCCLQDPERVIKTTNELGLDPPKVSSVLSAIDKPGISVTTSSVGRLFDSVATIILGITECRFEGEAAMRLESACDLEEPGKYDFPIREGAPFELDWRPAILQILEDRQAGTTAEKMSMRFHRGLAEAIFQLASRFSNLPVVLGGGVFQNRVLVEAIDNCFRHSQQELGLPGRIPVNDGGLAAGQLAIACSQLSNQLLQTVGTESCV